ncbi:MAG: acylphosphatase [Anaerolineae bacterium]|nr:acylphosphatase [Anaerolineae bacterium]
MPAKRAHVYISGHVQGVFFRADTQRLARQWGLTGWVRNLWDGRVEAVFEGDERDVERIVQWCWRGPEGAAVENVEVRYEEPTGKYKDFYITTSSYY